MKKITLILVFTLISTSSNAQFKKEMREKIRTYKIAFLTEKLALTESEAEKFWPVYNNFDKKMVQLRREEHMGIRKKIKKLGGLDNISDKQAKEIIEKMHYLAEERTKTKNIFFKKISTIIPYKKILHLEIAEHEFNRKLMRKLRGRK